MANAPLTKGRIVCVEASPSTFQSLSAQFEDMPKYICVHGAVHNSQTGDVVFFECDDDCLNTTNKLWLTDPSSRFGSKGVQREVSVKTIHIDTLIKTYGIPELCKIDVEGGEYEALLTLTQKIPLLCFEFAVEIQDIAINCMKYLETLGFTEWSIQGYDDYTFRPVCWGTFSEVVNIIQQGIDKETWGMIWAR